MRPGAWHQCGDKSQIVVKEHLKNGIGVGVVISPRDLAKHKAIEHARDYRNLKAKVLFDPQFFGSGWTNKQLKSYAHAAIRHSACQKRTISDANVDELAKHLEATNRELSTDAVIAPAVVYDAGQPGLLDLNAKLFSAAKRAGDALGKPTYGTIIIGKSAGATSTTMEHMLAHGTSLDANGWYFGFEFDETRVPASIVSVELMCNAIVTLAVTGRPVFHAFSCMMGPLSLAMGCAAAGIGASQNLWQFTRGRWSAPLKKGGGNADAPQRLFSKDLWGTIIYRDEFVQIPQALRDQVYGKSPYISPVTKTGPFLPWSRENAKRHMEHLVGDTLMDIAKLSTIAQRAKIVIELLQSAIETHDKIAKLPLELGDRTSSYQRPWKTAAENTLKARKRDFDYLTLLS